MKKLKRVSIHIFAVLVVLLVSSCDIEKKDPDRTDAVPVKLFSVSGVVTDAADKAPVSGITVTMTAYSLDDLSKTKPLYSDSYDTAIDGTYWLSCKDDSTESLTGVFFEFTLSDSSDMRSDHYKPTTRELYMTASSSFYTSSVMSYRVVGNDFSVSR